MPDDKSARNAAIYDLRLTGVVYRDIADLYRLPFALVKQICIREAAKRGDEYDPVTTPPKQGHRNG